MRKIDSNETIERLRTIFARFGIPLSITADNAKQLFSEEFKAYCEENNIKIISTIPYWPQQKEEVERQNRSILKRLIISQNTGRNWMDDLQDYLLMYRSTNHSTTLKTPSELIFGYNIRDKIPTIHQPLEDDEEIRDRDKGKKGKEKEYADKRRHAKTINIEERDEVLVKRVIKPNKLASQFDPIIHEVVERKGGEVIIQSSQNDKLYRRNVSHLKKLTDEELRAKRQVQRPIKLNDYSD